MATPTRNYKDYMQGWPIELQREMEATLEADQREVPEDTQASVLTKALTAPPPAPAEGARYLIYTLVPTGAWTGKAGNIAQRVGATWAFTAPSDGMMVWVEDEDLLYCYATTVWVPNPLAAHALVGPTHTAAGLTPAHVLRATGATTFAFGQPQHADLGGIGTNDHHNQAHVVDGADHTAAGLTAGHVMRATAATTFAFGQAQHNDLGGITADQHHAQAHAIDGLDHTGTLGHAALSGVSANQHHNQAHAIDGVDHTGTLGHAALSGVTTDQHHAQVHVLDSANHTVAGLTPGHTLRATAPTTFAFGQTQHTDLGGVSADQHHAQAHAIDGVDHTGSLGHAALSGVTADQHHAQNHAIDGATHPVSGLTPGNVLRATAPTTMAFGQAQHSDLGGVGANDHHAQAHAIDGVDHTGTLGHGALSGVTSDQHHAQVHVLDSANHTVAGLTTGHALLATGATTYGFGAIVPVYTNATRPLATAVLTGTMIFNTDDGAPNWSNGTNWVDASGNLT